MHLWDAIGADVVEVGDGYAVLHQIFHQIWYLFAPESDGIEGYTPTSGRVLTTENAYTTIKWVWKVIVVGVLWLGFDYVAPESIFHPRRLHQNRVIFHRSWH